MRKLLVPLFAVCLLAGCFPIRYHIPSAGDLHKKEEDIDELLKNSASRNDVISILGQPAREYEYDISYLGCYQPAGYGYRIILTPVFPFPPYGVDGDVIQLPEECYELILHFDKKYVLTSIEKVPFEGYLTIPVSTLQIYFNDTQHQDAKKWLCKAADEGDAHAQYRLGLLYENGAEGLKQDYVLAYVWYRLSETSGEYMRAGDQADRILDRLDVGQSMRAEKLIRDWGPGLCEKSMIQASDSAND
jgi:hypothetical protein